MVSGLAHLYLIDPSPERFYIYITGGGAAGASNLVTVAPPLPINSIVVNPIGEKIEHVGFIVTLEAKDILGRHASWTGTVSLWNFLGGGPTCDLYFCSSALYNDGAWPNRDYTMVNGWLTIYVVADAPGTGMFFGSTEAVAPFYGSVTVLSDLSG
jgi:hypothetical protein